MARWFPRTRQMIPSKGLPEQKPLGVLWDDYVKILREKGIAEIQSIRSYLEGRLSDIEVELDRDRASVLNTAHPTMSEDANDDLSLTQHYIDDYYPHVISRIEERLYVLDLLLDRVCLWEEAPELDENEKSELKKNYYAWSLNEEFTSKQAYKHFKTAYRIVMSNEKISGRKGSETKTAIIKAISKEASVDESTIRATAQDNGWFGDDIRNQIKTKAESIPKSVREKW